MSMQQTPDHWKTCTRCLAVITQFYGYLPSELSVPSIRSNNHLGWSLHPLSRTIKCTIHCSLIHRRLETFLSFLLLFFFFFHKYPFQMQIFNFFFMLHSPCLSLSLCLVQLHPNPSSSSAIVGIIIVQCTCVILHIHRFRDLFCDFPFLNINISKLNNDLNNSFSSPIRLDPFYNIPENSTFVL